MTRIPIEGVSSCIPPGVVVTLHVPIWKWLVSNYTNWSWISIENLWGQKHLVHQGEQIHEHIVYELGCRKFCSMAQNETTKDELENMLVSKSQTIGWTLPKCVWITSQSMHIIFDNNGKFTL